MGNEDGSGEDGYRRRCNEEEAQCGGVGDSMHQEREVVVGTGVLEYGLLTRRKREQSLSSSTIVVAVEWGTKGLCSALFSKEHYRTMRADAVALSWNELNMVLIGQVMALTAMASRN